MNYSSKQGTIGKRIRDIVWPIANTELRFFLPMALMMFCMIFNFAALRSVKDSLVVPNIGAEAISFLKFWLVLPSSILFTALYMKLSNNFQYKTLFMIVVSTFLLFFAIFTYVLFPYQDFFHPSDETIRSLIMQHPNFKWFIYIFGKWSYALMYIFCELWSVIIINLLFWQNANHIFNTQSAKRFYPILGIIGNMGLVFAGNIIMGFCNTNDVVANYASNISYQCESILKPIINIVIVSGITSILLYIYVYCYVIDKEKIFYYHEHSTKTKLSFRDSVKLLFGSKYLGHVIILVLCYGLTINIIEGPWKAKIHSLYPNTVDYLHFMGRFNVWMGVSCIIFMVIGSNILRNASWKFAALVTPLMFTFTGLIFFSTIINANELSEIFDYTNPIYFAVIVGAIQNILTKSTKYSLFDATKEMTYIPLSLELRTKGKAMVEVIGLKFGKSLGAFLQSTAFILVPMMDFDSIGQYLLIVFSVVMLLWMWNINSLSKEYHKLTKKSK